MPNQATTTILARHKLDSGHVVTTLEYKGRLAWDVGELSRALESGEHGRLFFAAAQEQVGLIEGYNYEVVKGNDLAELGLLGVADGPGRPKRVVLVYASGLELVLLASGSPVGRFLRHFLVENVVAPYQSTPAPLRPPPRVYCYACGGHNIRPPLSEGVLLVAIQREGQTKGRAVRGGWVSQRVLCRATKMNVAELRRAIEPLCSSGYVEESWKHPQQPRSRSFYYRVGEKALPEGGD